MLEAETDALPLAERAVVELESTATIPGILIIALTDRERAPAADESRTMIDALAVTGVAGAATGIQVTIAAVGGGDRVAARWQVRRG